MVAKARTSHHRWMVNLGLCLTLGLAPIAVGAGMIGDAPAILAIGAGLAILGIGLLVYNLVLTARYDPNTDSVELRQRLGQSRATLRTEFERLNSEQQRNPARVPASRLPDATC
jgi:hypothetical protein